MVNNISAELIHDDLFVSGDFVPIKVVLNIEEPIEISSLNLTLLGYVITSAFVPQKQVDILPTLVPANDYYHRFLLRVFELEIDERLQLNKGRYEIESRVEIPDKSTFCESKVGLRDKEESVYEPRFLLPPSYTHETKTGDYIAVAYLVLPLVNEDTQLDPLSGLNPKMAYSPCQVRVQTLETSIPPGFLTKGDICLVETDEPAELFWRLKADAFGSRNTILTLGLRLTACAFFSMYPMKNDRTISLTKCLRPGEKLNQGVSFSLGISFPRRVSELPDIVKVRCQSVKATLVEEVEYSKITNNEEYSPDQSHESLSHAIVRLVTATVKTQEIVNKVLNQDIEFELYHVSQPNNDSGRQTHYIYQCPHEWFEEPVPETLASFATAVLSLQYKLVVNFVFLTVEDPLNRTRVSVVSDVFINTKF